jgi:lipopolysaccharide export system permease protein
MLLLAVALAIGVIAAQQWLVPVLEQRASELRTKTFTTASREDAAYWTRQGDRLLRIGGVEMGMVPTDIEVYELDGEGQVRELRRAARADVLGPRDWLLRDVTTIRFLPGGPQMANDAVLPFTPDFDARQIFTLINADYALAPLDLLVYIRHLRSNSLESHRFEVLLWQQLSLPIGLMALSLLGLPVVMGSSRAISMGARIAIGAALGLGFYLVERLAMQLALLYHLSPPLTGLLPDLAMLAVALVLLLRRR